MMPRVQLFFLGLCCLGVGNRRNFRSQTYDLWTDAATVIRAVREEKESEETRNRKRKSQKKEDQSVQKGKKVAKHIWK